MRRADILPDDIELLKELLAASELTIAELNAGILERDEVIVARNDTVFDLQEQLSTSSVEIEQLKLLIAKLRRMQFGRKSEKLDHQIEQMELKLEDLQADESQAATEAEIAGKKPRRKSERAPLPPHLPRDAVVVKVVGKILSQAAISSSRVSMGSTRSGFSCT